MALFNFNDFWLTIDVTDDSDVGDAQTERLLAGRDEE
jgi:hypothetical protein